MSELTIRDPLLLHLYDSEIVGPDICKEISDEQARTGRSVRHIIQDLGILDETQLLEQIAAAQSTSIVNLGTLNIDPGTIRALPASAARMYNVVSITADPTSIVLATSELVNPEVIDELTFVLNRDVSFVVADEADIRDHIERHYGDDSDSVGDMLSALEAELEDAGELPSSVEGLQKIDLEQAASAAPVVRFVNLVLYQAVTNRASDIHFEPFETEFKIRYRVDGALYEMAPPPSIWPSL